MAGADPRRIAPKDLTRLDAWPAAALQALIADAVALSTTPRRDKPLAGARVALIQDDGGWRNTGALALGAQELGATLFRPPITLGGAEDPSDIGRFLSAWADLVAIRTPDLGRLERFAAACAAPVMNLRTRANHPFEILGDLAFVAAQRGAIDGLRVAVVAPAANILRSWAEAAAVLPIGVTQIAPDADRLRGWPPISHTDSLEAIAEADLVVTDCWPKAADGALWSRFRVDAAALERLPERALFIPCPPVNRAQEVDDAAMRHPACAVVAAKALLLHVQNAAMLRAADARVATARQNP